MKVWVASGGWVREGLAEPIGIFTSEARARQAVADGYKGYDMTEVHEYEINVSRDDGGVQGKSYKHWRPKRDSNEEG